MGLDVEPVDEHLIGDAEGPGEVALRMHGGLLGREPSLADQVLDEAVVLGDLGHVVAPQPVGPTVADVDDRDRVVSVQTEGDHGGAHASQARVDGLMMNLTIGLLDNVDQLSLGQLGPDDAELTDGQFGGAFTALVAAHAVGQRGDRTVEVHAVLIDLTHVADVRRRSAPQPHSATPRWWSDRDT